MAQIQEYQNLKECAKQELLKNNIEASLLLYRKCADLIISLPDIAKREKAIIFLNIAICYISKYQFEEGENYIEKSLLTDRSYIKAYYRKAILLKNKEKFIEALEICQEALKIEKNSEIMLLGVKKKDRFQIFGFFRKKLKNYMRHIKQIDRSNG